MSLGINRLFGLIDNDTFYSEFFFRKSFFLLCELLLRQHNDFDRRKKRSRRKWTFVGVTCHFLFTFRQLENNYLQCWIDVLESQCCQLFLFLMILHYTGKLINRFKFLWFFCVSKKVRLATLKKRHHPTTIFSFVRKVMI